MFKIKKPEQHTQDIMSHIVRDYSNKKPTKEIKEVWARFGDLWEHKGQYKWQYEKDQELIGEAWKNAPEWRVDREYAPREATRREIREHRVEEYLSDNL